MFGRPSPQIVPVVALALTVELLASAPSLDVAALALLASAAVAALVPAVLGVDVARRGAWRGLALSAAVAVDLVARAQPGVLSLPLELAAAVSGPWVAALALDLALDEPDAPAAFARLGWLRRLTFSLAAVASALGVLAALPALGDPASGWLVAPSWSALPPVLGLAQLGAAVGLRALRARLGSAPEALAAGSWALLGLVLALVAGALAAVLVGAGAHGPSSSVVRGLVAAGGLGLALGHVWMLDGQRSTRAAGTTRRVLAALGVAVGVGVLAARLGDRLPTDAIARGVWCVALLAAVAAALRLAFAGFDHVLAPDRGRLLHAVADASRALDRSRTIEEVGAAVIAPLKRAAGTREARPFLQTLDPARQIGVDGAGLPKVEARALAPAILARLEAEPGLAVVAGPLRAAAVRRPDLRPLVEALDHLEALAVLPLAVAGELEGALVVAAGRRRVALTLEEIAALDRLAARLAAIVSALQVEVRSQARAGRALLAQDRLEERVEALEDELARHRAEARILKAGRAADRLAAPAIAYSPAMRAAVARAAEVGAVDAPALLVAEAGTAVDAMGHQIHAASARRSGPFVVADCGAIRPERAMAALFGDEGEAGDHPGWLRLAAAGTLLLVDVPALPVEAQAALGEAIATRTARAEGGASSYPIDVRLLAHTRVDPEALVEAGSFDGDLARRLAPLRVDVPPLRARREDLPSLVLLALDRACRTLGREVMGVDEAALARLLAYDWPGNLRELQSIVDRAVLAATPPRVMASDLPMPAQAPEAPAVDPLDGTWVEVEERILRAALEKASGNKSEAARLLGLKRTTFLDKLRRAGLDDRESAPPDPPS